MVCKDCKNCLHYKACLEMAMANNADEFNTMIANKCDDYADRSEWVHLPCKAGDTIFLPWEWHGESGIARITVLRVVLTENESYIEADFDSDDYDYFMKYNCGVFRFGDFGKTVFTTKEEAEKALAGRSRK